MSVIIRDTTHADQATLIAFLPHRQDAERVLCASRRPGHEVDRSCYDALLNDGAHILLAEEEGRAIGFVSGRVKVDNDELQVEAWRRTATSPTSTWFPRTVAAAWRSACCGPWPIDCRARCWSFLSIGALSANKAAVKAMERFGFQPFQVRLDMERAQN